MSARDDERALVLTCDGEITGAEVAPETRSLMKSGRPSDALTEEEVMRALLSIEVGDDVAMLTGARRDTYSDVRLRTGEFMEYRTRRGWIFSIFNDSGDWGYVELAVAPDGRRAEPWAYASDTNANPLHWSYEEYQFLRDYYPPELAMWPGWRSFEDWFKK